MGKAGVLVISHGSRSPHWVRLVDEAVQAVRRPSDVPICSAFLEIVEGRLIQDGIDSLERQGVTELLVLPLFVSSGSTHLDEIQYAFGLREQPTLETELEPFRLDARVWFGGTLDEDADTVARMLMDQLQPLSHRPEREKVLVIGHGSAEEGFHERWRQGLDRIAGRLQTLGGFARAEGAMLLPDEAAERLARLSGDGSGEGVLVAPLFLSEGYFTEQVIPQRLTGQDYRYNGRAMLPHPLITGWMERQLTEGLRAVTR